MYEFISVLIWLSEQKMKIYPTQTLEQFKAVAAQTTIQNSSWVNILQAPELIVEDTYAQCLFFFKREKRVHGWTEEWVLIGLKWENKRKKEKERKMPLPLGSVDRVGLDQTNQQTQGTSCKTKAQSWGCEKSLWRQDSWLQPSTSVIPQDCLWERAPNLLCPVFQSVFTLFSTPCET